MVYGKVSYGYHRQTKWKTEKYRGGAEKKKAWNVIATFCNMIRFIAKLFLRSVLKTFINCISSGFVTAWECSFGVCDGVCEALKSLRLWSIWYSCGQTKYHKSLDWQAGWGKVYEYLTGTVPLFWHKPGRRIYGSWERRTVYRQPKIWYRKQGNKKPRSKTYTCIHIHLRTPKYPCF